MRHTSGTTSIVVVAARHYVVRGRVQGVGFRFFAEAAAGREGLHGHVVNREDGGVDVLAEGDLAALERFEAALRQGPAAARVDAVEVDVRAPRGTGAGFSILADDVWTR